MTIISQDGNTYELDSKRIICGFKFISNTVNYPEHNYNAKTIIARMFICGDCEIHLGDYGVIEAKGIWDELKEAIRSGNEKFIMPK